MNIKEIWNAWRESTPADKDMQRAFERACTPKACHGVLIELESANQKIAELEKKLIAPTDSGVVALDSICEKFNSNKESNLNELTCSIWNKAVFEALKEQE
jgi:hypothetical protein